MNALSKKILAVKALAVLALAAALCLDASSQTTRENILISTKDHVVSISTEGDKVVFVMEAIRDFTDEMKGLFPDVDFMSFDVDVDQNGLIDRNVDLGFFATKANGLCAVYLIDSGRNSTCGAFESMGRVELSFQGTKYEARKHPIYRYAIPKGELSRGRDCFDVVFTFHSSGRGYTYYPFRALKSTHALAKTIRIKL